MSTTNTPPPEIIVRFWPFSVSAKGKEAVSAVKMPLAIAIVLRMFLMGGGVVLAGWLSWPFVRLF